MGIIKNRWRTAIALIMVLFVATACFQTVGDEAQAQQVSLLIPTNTPPPTLTPVPSATATAADLPISNNPTETATPTDVIAVAQVGDEAQPGLQPTETDDEFELRATQLVIEATATAVAPLTQAAATLLGLTSTPLPTTAPLDTGTTNTTTFLNGADCVHEVRAGETMFRLSLFYGIPVNDIATRNGVVNPNIISIGQRLIINGCGTTGVLPPPTSTPTATATQFQLNTTIGTGGTDLGDTTLGAGGGATTTTGCIAQYTVQQYDTLFQISLQYGVAVQSIANVNGIVNLGRIDMGQVLCIPAQ